MSKKKYLVNLFLNFSAEVMWKDVACSVKHYLVSMHTHSDNIFGDKRHLKHADVLCESRGMRVEVDFSYYLQEVLLKKYLNKNTVRN